MPRLTDDPKVQDLIARAEARGANAERKRINNLIKEGSDASTDKAGKTALRDLKRRIRDEA